MTHKYIHLSTCDKLILYDYNLLDFPADGRFRHKSTRNKEGSSINQVLDLDKHLHYTMMATLDQLTTEAACIHFNVILIGRTGPNNIC